MAFSAPALVAWKPASMERLRGTTFRAALGREDRSRIINHEYEDVRKDHNIS